jgi:hypothetical protein
MEWNRNDPEYNWHIGKYFGLHYDFHANASDTDLGTRLTHEHLRAELEKVKPDWVQCDCKGVPGYTSWPTEVGSTAPGVVVDSLLIHREVTREMGIPLVMHYSGVWDSRAVELHPEWGIEDADGNRPANLKTEASPTCQLSGYTDELLIPQFLELIDKYDVDGFWVDADSWASVPCYCSLCRKEFTKRTDIADAPRSKEDPNWRTWMDFHRSLFDEHVTKYAEAVHNRKPGCLVSCNWMYTVGHPSEITVPVDYISGDFSHAWGTEWSILEGRFIASRGLSWDLMAWGFMTLEPAMDGWVFKPAAHLCQEVSTVIALGGAVTIYDNPQRNGHLNSWHQDTLAEVARFARARQKWCQNSVSIPQAVILHCAEHTYSHSPDNLLPVGQPVSAPLLGALHCLLENQINVDILNEIALRKKLNEYKLVVIPEQTNVSQEFKNDLAAFCEDGGRVLITGVNAASDFGDILGVEPLGKVSEGYYYLEIGGQATTVKGPRQSVELGDAEALRNVMKDQEPGENETDIPAVTINFPGEGAAIGIYSDIFGFHKSTNYPRTRRLIGELIQSIGADFDIEVDAPARLHICLRKGGGGETIVHMINMGTSHPTSPSQGLIEEVPPIEHVTITMKCPEKPSAVYLVPTYEAIEYEWSGGLLHTQIQRIGIMDSLVVEFK